MEDYADLIAKQLQPPTDESGGIPLLEQKYDVLTPLQQKSALEMATQGKRTTVDVMQSLDLPSMAEAVRDIKAAAEAVPGAGLIGKAIDLSLRPGSGVAGFGQTLLEGGKLEDAAAATLEALKGNKHFSWVEYFMEKANERLAKELPSNEGNVFVNAQGLTATAKDAYPWLMAGAAVTGLAFDLTLDPVIGAATTWKLLSLPEKISLLIRGSTVGKAMEKVTTLKPIDSLLAGFSTHFDQRAWPKTIEAFDKIRYWTSHAIRETTRQIEEFRGWVEAATKESGYSWSDYTRMTAVAREKGLILDPKAMRQAGFAPEFADSPYTYRIGKYLEEESKNQANKGVLAGLLDPQDLLSNYFPRIIMEKATGQLATRANPRGRPFFTMARERDATGALKYETVEDLQKALDAKAPGQWEVVTTGSVSLGIRKITQERAIAWRDYISKVLDEGKPWSQHVAEQLGFVSSNDLTAHVNAHAKALKIPRAEAYDNIIQSAQQAGKFLEIPKGHALVTTSLNLRGVNSKDDLERSLKHIISTETDNSLLHMISKSENPLVEVSPEMLGQLVAYGKEAYLLPTPLADMVKETFHMYSPSGSMKLLEHWDRILGVWKGWATSARPTFHARNMPSALWQMYASGVDSPRILPRLKDGMALLDGTYEGLGLDGKMARELAERLGVVGTGQVALDTLPWGGVSQLRKMSGDVPKNLIEATAGAYAHKMSDFGIWVDDTARAGSWIDKLLAKNVSFAKDPQAFIEAARQEAIKTRAYHIDYGDFTPLERQIKRFVPFYMWWKGNVKAQFKTLWEHPDRFAKLDRFSESLSPAVAFSNPETVEEAQLRPQWLFDVGATALPWKSPEGERLYAVVDLPPKDLRNLLTLKQYLGMVGPEAFIFEFLSGNIRASGDFTKVMPEARVAAPFYAQWLVSVPGLREMLDIGPFSDRTTGKEVIGMSPLGRRFFETAFPFLHDWVKVFPQAGSYVVKDSELTGLVSNLNPAGVHFHWASNPAKMGELNRRIQEASQTTKDLGEKLELSPKELERKVGQVWWKARLGPKPD